MKYFIGDIVLAKVKNYPYWPAKIVSVADAPANAARVCGQFMVHFFGSDNYSHVKKKDLAPFDPGATYPRSVVSAVAEASAALAATQQLPKAACSSTAPAVVEDTTNPHESPPATMFGAPPFSTALAQLSPKVPTECRDDDYQPSDSSSADGSDSETTQHPVLLVPASNNSDDDGASNPPKTRKRRKVADPSKWKKNSEKENRRSGKSYIDYKGRQKPAKQPTPVDCSSCRFHCSDKFSEDARSRVCDSYYALSDFTRKKNFILRRLKKTDVKRRKVGADKQKGHSIEYYFSTEDGSDERVCRQFFISTLAISINTVSTALKGMGGQGEFQSSDQRGKAEPKNKTSKGATALVHLHIKSFPTMAPHYVRRDTMKNYLQPGLNLRKLFRLYEIWCEETCDGAVRVKPADRVSEFVYRQIFHRDFNLGFFLPRKDQCAVCVRKCLLEGNDLQTYTTEVYAPHIKRKDEAAAAKQADKLSAKKDPTHRSINFDLQSVLYTPSSAVGTLYYKRKLAVYNLTVYEQNTHEGFCYLWDETIGKRGSNEIGSCVLKYLQSLPATIHRVSMYSDTCGGQNRNVNVAVMLLHSVVNSDSLEVIDQKFLESGHSYMEADSIHAVIENARRNAVDRAQSSMSTVIRIPQDWTTIIATARQKKGTKPYNVVSLEQSEIKDLKKLCHHIVSNRCRNSEGGKVNWMTVKWFQYRKSSPNTIFYKENYSDCEFKKIVISAETTRRCGTDVRQVSLEPAYTKPLPISSAKYNDLMSLVSGPNLVVDPFYAAFYKNLPHSSGVADTLAEPAEDEEETA